MSVLREAGVAVVLVTHDAEEAMSCADRLVLMADGRVLQSGSSEVCYRQPATIQAGRLLGPLNVLPARVVAGRVDSALGVGSAGDVPDGPADLLFRPEDLVFDERGVEARTTSVAFLGATLRLRLEVGGQLLEMNCPPRDAPTKDRVRVGLAPTARPTILPSE